MSTLLKALRRADQPQFTPYMPLMGLPVSQEEEPNRRWIWWAAGAPGPGDGRRRQLWLAPLSPQTHRNSRSK